MTTIIEGKYISDFDDHSCLSSYSDFPILEDTLIVVQLTYGKKALYKARGCHKLLRWRKPDYGMKGKYKIHWHRVHLSEIDSPIKENTK